MRDEAYYQEEKDSLSKPEDEKSLKSQINAARKDENVSVEEQIDTYMSSRVAAGEMSEQQGNEVGNLIKHELDGRDGNQDGKVDDEELSRRDVRRGLLSGRISISPLERSISSSSVSVTDCGAKAYSGLPS